MRKIDFIFPQLGFRYLSIILGICMCPCLAYAGPEQSPSIGKFNAPKAAKPPIAPNVKKPTGKVIVTPLLSINGQAEPARLPFKPKVFRTPQMSISGAPEPKRLPFEPRAILTPKLEITGAPIR